MPRPTRPDPGHPSPNHSETSLNRGDSRAVELHGHRNPSNKITPTKQRSSTCYSRIRVAEPLNDQLAACAATGTVLPAGSPMYAAEPGREAHAAEPEPRGPLVAVRPRIENPASWFGCASTTGTEQARTQDVLPIDRLRSISASARSATPIPYAGIRRGRIRRARAAFRQATTVVREVAEESGITIELTGLAGVYSDATHVLVDPDDTIHQQLALCFHAVPAAPTDADQPRPDHDETDAAAWFSTSDIDNLKIHPAMLAPDRSTPSAASRRIAPSTSEVRMSTGLRHDLQDAVPRDGGCPRELAELIAARYPDRIVHMVGDAAYVGERLRDVDDRITWTSRLKVTSVLHELPPPRTGRSGRPRTRGPRLGTPTDLAAAATAGARWRGGAPPGCVVTDAPTPCRSPNGSACGTDHSAAVPCG